MKGIKSLFQVIGTISGKNQMAPAVGDSFVIASIELLAAAPAFVTRVEKFKRLTLQNADTQGLFLPNPIYPSGFIANLPRGETSKKSPPPVYGFKNPDNACHLNAVISTIINLPRVQQTHTLLHTSCGVSKNCGMCAFIRLFAKTSNPPGGKATSIKASSFGKLFSKVIRCDASGDASNDLMHLLQFLRREEAKSHDSLSAKRLHAAAPRTRYEADDELIEMTSAVGRYFSFVISDSEECKDCGELIKRTPDLMWSLPIYLTESDSLNSAVNDRFNDSEAPHKSCSKCGSTNRSSFWTMESSPAYLIARVIARSGKQAARPSIDYFETVMLSPEYKFALSGAVCVRASRATHHYYALVNRAGRGGKSWTLIDDDKVSELTETEVQKRLVADSYVLFLENIGEIRTFDQQVTPPAEITYEATDCPLAESCRVTDKSLQLATGIGLDHPVTLDLVALPSDP